MSRNLLSYIARNLLFYTDYIFYFLARLNRILIGVLGIFYLKKSFGNLFDAPDEEARLYLPYSFSF